MYGHVRLGEMTAGARRGLLYLLILAMALIGGSYYQSSRSQNRLAVQQAAQHRQQIALHKQQAALARALAIQHRQTLKLCQLNADLGNVAASPVTLNPATHKATRLGIVIIVDFRTAFRGLGCPGRLRNPGPSFTHWAKKYGLPYR